MPARFILTTPVSNLLLKDIISFHPGFFFSPLTSAVNTCTPSSCCQATEAPTEVGATACCNIKKKRPETRPLAEASHYPMQCCKLSPNCVCTVHYKPQNRAKSSIYHSEVSEIVASYSSGYSGDNTLNTVQDLASQCINTICNVCLPPQG